VVVWSWFGRHLDALLAGGLTGANFATEASSFLDAEGPPPGTGQLFIAIDANAFGNALISGFNLNASELQVASQLTIGLGSFRAALSRALLFS
jgi:hypothetical protein